jgi:hypothetical protein
MLFSRSIAMPPNQEEHSTVQDFPSVIAHAIVRTAELLIEADGYDPGDEVDLPEQMAFVISWELLRRRIVRGPQLLRFVIGNYDLSIRVEGTLALSDDHMPESYRARGLVMKARFRDLSPLSTEQLISITGHAVSILTEYLDEVYDFRCSYRILQLIPVLRILSEEVEQRHLDAAYRAHLLFAD